MKTYSVRLTPEAEADLFDIYLYIRDASGSAVLAANYLSRLRRFLSALEIAPERGTIRTDVREGLRIIGFERAASIAFVVENENVVILRIAYRGKLLGL
ncbi:type II toxin-antitoxin system RelE/ParE family toxin [Rhizobium sp. FY34]|uniref:type II toxin-antitoxin system RelE/ParE family toxin n=1 Tax=Rhizobium sp. FY34 TaxID=2562309 RepID=UPI0010C08B2B|nr:type II toxin-antitoxin system RelE/ParE family toxin [Rhizobium sp. FY34]